MNRKLIALFVVCLALAACVTSDPAGTAFSTEWVNSRERSADYEKRVERVDSRDLVLAGRKGKNQAAVELDEDGKTKVYVGKKTGFRADLDVSHGKPDVKLRYKIKW